MVSGRVANLVLFVVTAAELWLLVVLAPALTPTDWVYVAQHVLVLGLAVLRHPARARDQSAASAAAVVVSYAYPYAQVLLLRSGIGREAWPDAGDVLVKIAAGLSLVSLLTLGRSFGVRPALRRLATKGPYRLVRHPIYLSYVVADVGLNLIEWTGWTVALVLVGWASLVFRVRAEERILSKDAGWEGYRAEVPHRVIPWLW